MSLFKILVNGMIIAGLLYAGACVYANFIQIQPGDYKVPQKSEARYLITIRNTGNVLFTNDYSVNGSVYTLQGYWEIIDNKYKYRSGQLLIDKKIYGTITIRRR